MTSVAFHLGAAHRIRDLLDHDREIDDHRDAEEHRTSADAGTNAPARGTQITTR